MHTLFMQKEYGDTEHFRSISTHTHYAYGFLRELSIYMYEIRERGVPVDWL